MINKFNDLSLLLRINNRPSDNSARYIAILLSHLSASNTSIKWFEEQKIEMKEEKLKGKLIKQFHF